MGRSVRISEEAARAVLVLLDGAGIRTGEWVSALRGALARLDRVPKAPPKSRRPRSVSFNAAMADLRAQKVGVFASRKPSKEEKSDETSAIRQACLQRAEGKCECGCDAPAIDWDRSYSFPEAKAELDHFFGRGKAKQSVETCWILRANCHREKTNNRPDAAAWLERFIAHCARYGYGQALRVASARRYFTKTRSSLPAAPRTR